jgi:hypothetical protein
MTVAPDWWLTQSHRSQSLRSSGNTTGTSLSRVFGYCANVHNTNPVEISSAGESRIREMFMGNTWNDRRRASFAPSFTINSSQQPSRQRARVGCSIRQGSRPDHPFGGRQAAGAAARRGCRAARAPPAPTTPRNVACQPNRPFTSTPTATPATIARVSPPVIIDRRGQTAGLDPVRRHTLAAGMAENTRSRRAARALHGLPPVR